MMRERRLVSTASTAPMPERRNTGATASWIAWATAMMPGDCCARGLTAVLYVDEPVDRSRPRPIRTSTWGRRAWAYDGPGAHDENHGDIPPSLDTARRCSASPVAARR